MDVTAASRAVDDLIAYAISSNLLDPRDGVWARNGLLSLIGCPSYRVAAHGGQASSGASSDPDELTRALADWACANGSLEDTPDARERLACAAMNCVMPRPSDVEARFEALLSTGCPDEACEYLYDLSCAAAYVHAASSARNIRWINPSAWGDIEITINRAKPEKDPRAIAARAACTQGPAAGEGDAPYPSCPLCLDNEGYEGRAPTADAKAHPARQNLRTVTIPLGGDSWRLQFSPYTYYEQHCIVINPAHTPMHIDGETLARLLDFVDLFPRYFVGSNADLPIVGGSILDHDHFQGGLHTFPLEKAPLARAFSMEEYPHVSCGMVDWPLSVIRLTSEDRDELLAAALHVIETWRAFSAPEVNVIAETDGTPHNTVTPIARLALDADETGTARRRYTLHLALRCNLTSDEFPLGIFHPHPHLHHIKKENIGLIEVMGLAILPGRLASELSAVEEILCRERDPEKARAALESCPLTVKHAAWALEVAASHPELNEENARSILQRETGNVFCEVLACAGVFDASERGQSALDRFIAALS